MDIKRAVEILEELLEKKWAQKALGSCIISAIRTLCNFAKQYIAEEATPPKEPDTMEEVIRVGTYLLLYFTYEEKGTRRCIICGLGIRPDPADIYYHFRTRHGPVLARVRAKVMG